MLSNRQIDLPHGHALHEIIDQGFKLLDRNGDGFLQEDEVEYYVDLEDVDRNIIFYIHNIKNSFNTLFIVVLYNRVLWHITWNVKRYFNSSHNLHDKTCYKTLTFHWFADIKLTGIEHFVL